MKDALARDISLEGHLLTIQARLCVHGCSAFMFRVLRLTSELASRRCLPARVIPRCNKRFSPPVRLLTTTRAAAMPSLPEIACERSGVPAERAFAIDDVKLYERVGGLETFKKLSTEFYNRVYDDKEPLPDGTSFRALFSNFKKESAIRNQYEFVIQRLGGPPLYSQRKGHPALMARHAPFRCDEHTAERYMKHMVAALDAMPEIDADSKQRLHDYFRHTCFFIAAGQEVMQTRRWQIPAQQAQQPQQPQHEAQQAQPQQAQQQAHGQQQEEEQGQEGQSAALQ